MKILLPYDGSKNAEIALRGLQHHGNFALEKQELLIVVTDVWLPESMEEFSRLVEARRRNVIMSGASSYAPSLRAEEEERVLLREVGERIPSMFPLSNVRLETLPGFSLVSSEILEKAKRWAAHMIVIGVEDMFAAEKSGYGAGALRVVKKAECNVHLARGKFNTRKNESFETLPADIALILDDPVLDAQIIESITCRKWSKESEIRIITVRENAQSSNESQTADALRAAGLKISTIKSEVESLSEIIETMNSWSPDCIFVGDNLSNRTSETNGRREFTRVIEALLRQTQCPVEIVRQSPAKPKFLSLAA